MSCQTLFSSFLLIGHWLSFVNIPFLFNLVRYIHSAKLVHRDIKPGNIMLNEQTDVVIIDFGMCRTIQDRRSQLSYDVGTRPYKAPELHAQSPVYCQASDIWSIGLLLIQLYTSKMPIQVVNDRAPSVDISEAYIKLILAFIGPQDKNDILSINRSANSAYSAML